MTQTSDEIDYRKATPNDGASILEVLEEVAPEIPVSLDTPENQEKIKTIIIQCYQSGKSWVAVDADDNVIGCALAMPDFDEVGAISLPYVGVRPNSRRQGIFSGLMKKLKANGVPITATVLHGNRSAMADLLVKKFEFKKVESKLESNAPRQTKFRWAAP